MIKQEMIFNVDGADSRSRISSVELYRFIEWVVSAAFCLFLTLWAFIPEEVLQEKLGTFQFPNRYYILACGNWFGVTLLWV